ncbi:MAG: glycosyltransferase, partial [Gemmatimonadota bacterium]|nr:glycosyltransferase [Gemmatimonadota bacterium]
MRILVLAPHPFFQARGTPLAVKTVLEFLSARGHEVDVLTFNEGEDLDIPNCRIYRIASLPWIRNIRPGFSAKKVISDLFMLAKCLRMVRQTRYDLIHAVEESAFIAAAMQSLTGVPYVYDMDSSLAEQMVDAYPGLHFAFPVLRRCEALAVRRSLGVLTVCAALEDVAHGHAPDKTVGRVEDTTLLAPGAYSANGQAAETRLPPGVGDQSLVAMYVGNLEHYQGIGLLIDGFRHTIDRIPNAHLVIVGGLDQD